MIQTSAPSGRWKIWGRLIFLAMAVVCVLAFAPGIGAADHTDAHTLAIDSDNISITPGDDSPGATTYHNWSIQVSEEFGEIDRIELKYRDKDSTFDEEISEDDLVAGNINVVGGGSLDVDQVYDVSGDIWFDINESYLPAGATIEIAWSNPVFENPSETGTEYISMEMRDFDEDYYGKGVGWVFIPGHIELNDLKAKNTDSNQLSEYQFEFSVKEHSIDDVLYFHADFSDAYEDGLNFEDMDQEWDSDDFWMENASGYDVSSFFRGTSYDGDGVLRFETSADRLETDTGGGPYTVGLKNIRNPDTGTDYEFELRINDTSGDTGPTAIDNATFDIVESPTMSIDDTGLTNTTTLDPGKYEIDVEFATADADDVDGFSVEFVDADTDADNLTAADVEVTDAVVDEVNTTDDVVKVELAEPVTYQENEQATIVLDGVTNPMEVGDIDLEVEFYAYGNRYGNASLADAFTIEPSLVLGDWESPRSTPNGSVSLKNISVENIGEADLTNVRVYLGADSDENAFERSGTLSAAPEYWLSQTIDAGERKEYELDIATADYFDIGENYETGEDFYHGPSVGLEEGWSFLQEDADPHPFYISESDASGSITASVENQTGQPVDGAQVDLYVHEVAPENLVASEHAADSTVTFDESHPDIEEGLAVGPEEAEAVEYVVVAEKDGYDEGTETFTLAEGTDEVSGVVTISTGEPDIEVTSYSFDPDPAEEDLHVGDTLAVNPNVTNHGDAAGDYDVEYIVDDEVVANQTVTVDATTTETVELTHALRENGTKTISVNGVDPVQIYVQPAPASLTLESVTVPDHLERGLPLEIEAEVTNTGGEAGEGTVSAAFAGLATEETVSVDADTTNTVSLSFNATETLALHLTNYTVSVDGPDSQTTHDLTVQPRRTYTVSVPNDGDAHAFGVPAPVNGTLADILDNQSVAGSIYAYDGGWERVTDFESVEPTVGDAYVLATVGDGSTVDLAVSLELEGSGNKSVNPGWNLLSATSHAPANESFGDGLVVTNDYGTQSPVALPQGDTFGSYIVGSEAWGDPAPTTSPFAGYFVYYDEPATLESVVETAPLVELGYLEE